ncbi:hypothetical protein HMPREF1548_05974 [Clostridium sp. KLE 1755]|nr:hypothetical protein HMPREF1548_05974 [Clostridium sp. KLE 1755]
MGLIYGKKCNYPVKIACLPRQPALLSGRGFRRPIKLYYNIIIF